MAFLPRKGRAVLSFVKKAEKVPPLPKKDPRSGQIENKTENTFSLKGRAELIWPDVN